MADAPIDPRVLQALEQDRGIVETFGLTLEKALDGRCEFSCVVPQSLVNAAGFAHGSVVFTLLDTGCAYALSSLGVRGVTLNANTTYIKAAQGGSRLTATASVVSRTRRTATLRGEVYLADGGEQLLAAHGSFVFQLLAID